MSSGTPPPHQRGSELALARRWWGLLGIAVQRVVARCVTEDAGVDLPFEALKAPPGIADLRVQ